MRAVRPQPLRTWLTWVVLACVVLISRVAWAQPTDDDVVPSAPPPGGAGAPTNGEAGAADQGDAGARAPDPYAEHDEGAGRMPQLPAGEAELARGLPIVAIETVGNRRVSFEDIMTYLRMKAGQLFRPEDLSRDVREMWESGYFDDIVVELTRTDDGVRLRFILRERSTVREVTFEGNQQLDQEKLQEAVEVKANTILSYPAIRRSVQKIRDMYAEQGYFLAEVEHEVLPQR
ncbi:MAG: outer membrane protein assembly factor BamA, partial [Polyangiaceae bacterium]|nr:outer membrane protein assembly factor BamA [Polyangiaceae bacterium]